MYSICAKQKNSLFPLIITETHSWRGIIHPLRDLLYSHANRKHRPLNVHEFITRVHRFGTLRWYSLCRWSWFSEYSQVTDTQKSPVLTSSSSCCCLLLEQLVETMYRSSLKWDSTALLILCGDDASTSFVSCNIEKGEWLVKRRGSCNLRRL